MEMNSTRILITSVYVRLLSEQVEGVDRNPFSKLKSYTCAAICCAVLNKIIPVQYGRIIYFDIFACLLKREYVS